MSIYMTKLSAFTKSNTNFPVKTYGIFDGKLSKTLGNMNADYFGKLAPHVHEMLEDQLELPADDVDDQVDDDDFSIDIDNDHGSKDYTSIIEVLRAEDTRDQAVTTLIEVCETAIELDKGQKNEEAALKALAQINSK